MKIGAITIGQSPRNDIVCEVLPLLSEGTELIQRGALDDLSLEEILALAPVEGDSVLITRLLDGTNVSLAEKYIVSGLQRAIDYLEAEGVKFIVFFCTGNFTDLTSKNVPLIFPCDLMHSVVPLLSKTSEMVAVSPSPLQKEEMTEIWGKYMKKCHAISASPYESWDLLVEAAREARDLPGDILVMDCIGYTQEMKEMFAKESGKTIILPRTFLARIISELTDI